MTDRVPEFVISGLARLGVTLSSSQLDLLADYLDRLLLANKQFNLTAVCDRDHAWRRHIIDSLTLLTFLDQTESLAKLIDVGSGGGLPGVPLAIARPNVHVTLLESTGKKARFCRQIADELPLDHVNVISDRAETIARQTAHRQQYDAAVCRALGPMRLLLEYTVPLVRVGGVIMAMKGPKAQGELEEAQHAMDVLGCSQLQVFDAYPPDFQQHTVIMILRKQSATSAMYPRGPGLARRTPL